MFLVFIFSISSHFLFSTTTVFLLHLAPKMSSTAVKHCDGRLSNRMENYTKFWNADLSKEKDADHTNRLDNYTEVVNGQFHLLTFFSSPKRSP